MSKEELKQNIEQRKLIEELQNMLEEKNKEITRLQDINISMIYYSTCNNKECVMRKLRNRLDGVVWVDQMKQLKCKKCVDRVGL